MEYNKFSPYTPIAYNNDDFTRFAHQHIDLVGYINKNQNNTLNYFYKDYNDYTQTDEETIRNMDWHNAYDLLTDYNKKGDKHHSGHANSRHTAHSEHH